MHLLQICSKSLRVVSNNHLITAQHKIPVVLSFPYHRHKAGGASPLGVARAACFEDLAGVFASCGALL